jgi:hypothetical protein
MLLGNPLHDVTSKIQMDGNMEIQMIYELKVESINLIDQGAFPLESTSY